MCVKRENDTFDFSQTGNKKRTKAVFEIKTKQTT